MAFFITVLRALAACLITNAHYTGIYPTDLIANGGLIGDVLFFAISGYCLYNIQSRFITWYSRRLVRCYLPVALITLVYMLLGVYSLNEHDLLWWYVYPTSYHFVASIVVLYIPYFMIMSIRRLKEHIPLVMMTIAVLYLLIYIFAYDKSYYHIDTVREPMIRFLFMESMLLGAYFRQNDSHFRNSISMRHVVSLVVSFALYFVSKIVFARGEQTISTLQFVNQVFIFILLYFILRVFSGLDQKLEKMPKWIKSICAYIASITLEIYVVQYVLIDWIRPLFGFPVNWLALTSAILVVATALHYACKGVMKVCSTVAK